MNTTDKSDRTNNDRVLNISNYVITFLALLLNILTILLVFTKRKHMKSMDLIMFSFSIVNIIYVVTIDITTAANLHIEEKISNGETIFYWAFFLLTLFSLNQCLHILLLAIQRYTSVHYPFKARVILKLINTRSILIVFWIATIIISIAIITLTITMPSGQYILTDIVKYFAAIFIITTGVSLTFFYSSIIYALCIKGKLSSLKAKKIRLVTVCCLMALSFMISYIPLSFMSVLSRDVNDILPVYHFKLGYNFLIAADLILNPLMYHLNVAFNTNEIYFCAEICGGTDTMAAVRRIINAGFIIPTNQIGNMASGNDEYDNDGGDQLRRDENGLGVHYYNRKTSSVF